MADLHHIIHALMEWDDCHLHKFRIYAKDYGIHYDDGMSFSDDADQLTIDQFQFDTGDKFAYEYNFFARLEPCGGHWVTSIPAAIFQYTSQKWTLYSGN